MPKDICNECSNSGLQMCCHNALDSHSNSQNTRKQRISNDMKKGDQDTSKEMRSKFQSTFQQPFTFPFQQAPLWTKSAVSSKRISMTGKGQNSLLEQIYNDLEKEHDHKAIAEETERQLFDESK